MTVDGKSWDHIPSRLSFQLLSLRTGDNALPPIPLGKGLSDGRHNYFPCNLENILVKAALNIQLLSTAPACTFYSHLIHMSQTPLES